LNALLPQLTSRVTGELEQINLRAFGFFLNLPGTRIPTIIGPFGLADARAYVSQQLNWSDIKNWKSAQESEKAAQFSYKRDRDLVVLTTGDAYLLVISDAATVESIRARVERARTLYQNDVDQNRQGVIASIDVLRAQVELQTEQQRLISAENQLSIDKLVLARVIGLPNGQDFRITDLVPYAPLMDMSLEDSLKQALTGRIIRVRKLKCAQPSLPAGLPKPRTILGYRPMRTMATSAARTSARPTARSLLSSGSIFRFFRAPACVRTNCRRMRRWSSVRQNSRILEDGSMKKYERLSSTFNPLPNS
jgi:hypothetical protein